jgi:hypothetical protein
MRQRAFRIRLPNLPNEVLATPDKTQKEMKEAGNEPASDSNDPEAQYSS